VTLCFVPDVRYVEEPREGLDFARKRAVADSSGDVVAFLDDDAVADPCWLAPLVAAFEADTELALCFGRVEALSQDTPGAMLFEANGGFGRGLAPIDLPTGAKRLFDKVRAPLAASIVSIGSGCSMAIRRVALIRIGGFDTALDLGRALPGGGDLDVVWRFLESGYRVRYEPKSLALHEHRVDAKSAIHQIAEHNRGLIATLTKIVFRSRGEMRAGGLLFLLWRLVKPGWRIVRRLVRRDPLPVAALLRIWWSCWRGLFAYRIAKQHALSRERAVAVLDRRGS
jgi:GT2 family glycosyltransferase